MGMEGCSKHRSESSVLSPFNSGDEKMRDPGNEDRLFLLSCSE